MSNLSIKQMLDYELKARKEGFTLIIGLDEAGRGPLAGPVVAAAVALKNSDFKNKITDSKKMTPAMREKAFHEIFAHGYVGIGIINETVIDEHNILQATFFAMTNAVRHLVARLPASLRTQKSFNDRTCLLVDGNRFKSDLPFAYKTIVQGDSLCLSIACASIVAKVTRDRILHTYGRIYPQYGFAKHKGYGTQEHRQAIAKHGLSMIHRRSFSFSTSDVGEQTED